MLQTTLTCILVAASIVGLIMFILWDITHKISPTRKQRSTRHERL